MNTVSAVIPDPAAPLVAITGATGFIGRRLVIALASAGWRVRVLLRRDPVVPEWRDLHPQVVAGFLDDEGALEQLVEGANAVIHLAGLIKASRRSQFFHVNRDGAAAMARTTARIAPRAHILLVSSQAAREPGLSDYGASKRAGEEAVREISDAQSTIVRPPAVYGPGDRETLVFFQLARRKIIPLVGTRDARAAMIHVDDLANLLATLAGAAPRRAVMVPSDVRPEGYGWEEIFRCAAHAVGNEAPRFLQAPRVLLRTAAFAGDVARAFGSANMLNSQKLRELRHPDWTVSNSERACVPGWAPRFTLQAGFADAVAWYRAAGWLPPA